MNAFVEHAAVGDDIGGVARHEQALEARPQGFELLPQVAAAHFGHHHVGHQQVDLAGVLSRQLDRSSRAAGGQHGIAQLLQQHSGELEQRLLVLDQQHGLRAGRHFGRLGAARRWRPPADSCRGR